MMTFIENFVHVTLFILFVVAIVSVLILAAIEGYDRITGADKKRQAQLDRLRQLEEDDY
jgi:type II secretory pathway pseudopilin PulG